MLRLREHPKKPPEVLITLPPQKRPPEVLALTIGQRGQSPTVIGEDAFQTVTAAVLVTEAPAQL